MKFVTYNIQYSKGKDGRCDLGRIADALDGADLTGQGFETGDARRPGGHRQMAAKADHPIDQLIAKTVEHRQHHEQRADAKGDAGEVEPGDERHLALLPPGA